MSVRRAGAGLLLSLLLLVACRNQAQPTGGVVAGTSGTATDMKSPLKDSSMTRSAPVEDKCSNAQVVDNLRIAADTRLPVSTTVITSTTLSAPTVEKFIEQTQTEPSADAIRRRQAEGQVWVFSFDADEILLRIGVHTSTGENNSPVATYLDYSFPRGNLVSAADLTSLVEQLHTSLSKRQVGAARVEVTVPRPGPSQYLVWSGPLDLKALAKDVAAASSQYCGHWTRQSVLAWSTSSVITVPVDVLNLGNGVSVGFARKSFMTQSMKSGTLVTTWYAIPDLTIAETPRATVAARENPGAVH